MLAILAIRSYYRAASLRGGAETNPNNNNNNKEQMVYNTNSVLAPILNFHTDMHCKTFLVAMLQIQIRYLEDFFVKTTKGTQHIALLRDPTQFH